WPTPLRKTRASPLPEWKPGLQHRRSARRTPRFRWAQSSSGSLSFSLSLLPLCAKFFSGGCSLAEGGAEVPPVVVVGVAVVLAGAAVDSEALAAEVPEAAAPGAVGDRSPQAGRKLTAET